MCFSIIFDRKSPYRYSILRSTESPIWAGLKVWTTRVMRLGVGTNARREQRVFRRCYSMKVAEALGVHYWTGR